MAARITVTSNTLDASYHRVKKGIVNLSDGRSITVVQRSATQVAFYGGNTDTTGWALLTLKTLTASPGDLTSRYALVVSPDEDSLYYIWLTSANVIRSIRIDISGWTVGGDPATQWVFAAEQTVMSSAAMGGDCWSLDADVSDGGAVLVGIIYFTGVSPDRLGFRTAVRDTASGTWRLLTRVIKITSSGTGIPAAFQISVAWFRNASATNRRFTILMGWGSTLADGGVSWYHASVNETDGSGYASQNMGNIPALMTDFTWKSSFNAAPRKIFLWQTSDAARNEQVFGCVRAGPNDIRGVGGAIKITGLAANAAFDEVHEWDTLSQISPDAIPSGAENMTATYSKDLDGVHTLNFLSRSVQYSDSLARLVAMTLKLGTIQSFVTSIAPQSVTWRRAGDWDSVASASRTVIPSTHAPDFIDKSHSVATYFGTPLWDYSAAVPQVAPSGMTPSAGQVLSSSKPSFSETVTKHTWLTFPPVWIPVFEVAKNSGFTVSPSRIIGEPQSEGPASTTILTSLWTGLPIASGDWYSRALVRDLYGNESPWRTNGATWKITHPMSAKITNPPPQPGGYAFVMPYSDPDGLGYMDFPIEWQTVDAWTPDVQSKYLVTITDVDAGNTIVYNSGSVVSNGHSVTGRIPVASKNHNLIVGVQLWDQYNESVALGSAAAALVPLITYDPPTVDDVQLVTVGPGGVCNSNAPVFQVQFTGSLSPIISLGLAIRKAGAIIFATSMANPIGNDVTFPTNSPILDNHTDYTATFTVTDNNGVSGDLDFGFTTEWTPPPAPTGVRVSTAEYNVENKGAVLIEWNGLDADDDFLAWNVYRKVDTLDAFGNVAEEGELEQLWLMSSNADTNSYRDYFAPSAYRVGYVVRQVVNRFGSTAESINSAVIYVKPVSDGYWLIDPTPEDNTASAFKLHNVISDSYDHEYEEEVIHVIGKGRHVDRGDDLGISGSLTCQLRHTGGTTARQKKLRLEQIKKEVRSLFLRTPFGDAWFVSVGNLGVGRVAGVGTSEFVDVTVPYTEVYQ